MSALRDLCKCLTTLSVSSSDTEVGVGWDEGGGVRCGEGTLLGVTDLNGHINGTTVPLITVLKYLSEMAHAGFLR